MTEAYHPGMARPVWLGVAVAAGVLLAAAGENAWRSWRQPEDYIEAAGRVPGGLPFHLEERAAAAGLSFTHEGLRTTSALHPWDRRLFAYGASVAVADVDGDGWMDVYVTNSALGSRNHLFINRHDGTFRDESDRYGIGDVNRVQGSWRALFLDLDNDGKEDLVLTGVSGRPRVFMQRRGRFVEQPEEAFEAGDSSAINALDLDGDGFLDLVIGYTRPFDFDPEHPARFDIFNRSMQTSHMRPGRLRAYRNDGHGRFSPMPGLFPPNPVGVPLAVGVSDLDGDGRPYIHWAMDLSPRDRLFNLVAPGVLEPETGKMPRRHRLNSMSSEIADVDGDGQPLLYVTQIHDPGWQIGHNFLLKRLKDGRFVDVAERRGGAACGWSWGAKFIDLDLDGRLDLVVANGMISGRSDFRYRQGVLMQASAQRQVDIRNWPPFGDSSLSGYQRDCVFYNAGGRFVEVGREAGLTSLRDGRGVAAIDIGNDGTPAFLVANQGQPLELYVSKSARARRWIGFVLKPKRGPRDPFGARVVLALDDGRRLSTEVQPCNGYCAQSDPRPKFGLGGARPLWAEVRWPSGRRQRLDAPREGRYNAVEER